MTLQRDESYTPGHDTPEIVLRVVAAPSCVPGLWDCELLGPGIYETFHDLTVGQVESVARDRGARIERVG